MAVTATASIAAGTGIATVGAPSGGVLVAGMTITGGSIALPVSPAIVLGTQLTGTTGQAGTYNTSTTSAVASASLTFTLVLKPIGLKTPLIGTGALPIPTTPSPWQVIPPKPLPSGTANTSVGIPI